ncbi:hypothetical protein BCR33DRAFT_837903 [Rhizoclosmatium globosum]|uniref:Uncharacterized protein n=1 Tax=Rhizoclosmatium globosum TaxID=329046 RepID=A0A1Y2BHZ9_9FUNG|nr:hypothetical protein BCR33DRAFT_837903 [Rhizoclosmatium globosum]|eukprot:ORY34414.1 hypothetical protein BCR33DRAFT_837903 [Rhizoclosmatium globosum]
MKRGTRFQSLSSNTFVTPGVPVPKSALSDIPVVSSTSSLAGFDLLLLAMAEEQTNQTNISGSGSDSFDTLIAAAAEAQPLPERPRIEYGPFDFVRAPVPRLTLVVPEDVEVAPVARAPMSGRRMYGPPPGPAPRPTPVPRASRPVPAPAPGPSHCPAPVTRQLIQIRPKPTKAKRQTKTNTPRQRKFTRFLVATRVILENALLPLRRNSKDHADHKAKFQLQGPSGLRHVFTAEVEEEIEVAVEVEVAEVEVALEEVAEVVVPVVVQVAVNVPKKKKATAVKVENGPPRRSARIASQQAQVPRRSARLAEMNGRP